MRYHIHTYIYMLCLKINLSALGIYTVSETYGMQQLIDSLNTVIYCLYIYCLCNLVKREENARCSPRLCEAASQLVSFPSSC